MTRKFGHEFYPAGANPVPGPQVELTIQEIEDAGLREVLQTPGAPISSWSFLGSLLQPGEPFVFHEPLGQAREVKVALSGLFGRFVARAYLERYCNLSVFHHPGQGPIHLSAARCIFITANDEGDWPDWVACTKAFSDLALAEAKGTHDKAGPKPALSRAWKQVQRVDVVEHGRKVPVKRIAIATRWGMATGGPGEPRISVHDPEDEGDTIDREQKEAIFVGLFRHHTASMISRLGHPDLAKAIRNLTEADSRVAESEASDHARRLLEESSDGLSMSRDEYRPFRDSVGGVVTRAGPMTAAAASRLDLSRVESLDLRPVFVGIHREVVNAAIEGNLGNIKEALVLDKLAGPEPYRSDGVGSWIIPLDRASEARDET